MLCEKCRENHANIRIEKIVNGKKTKSYFCTKCAYETDFVANWDNFYKNFLHDALSHVKTEPEKKSSAVFCDNCGMTLEQFKKAGRLGCASCYRSFKTQLLPIIKGIQGGLEHHGKIPAKIRVNLVMKKNIERLKKELEIAVKNERFEEAVVLRDRIKELTNSESESNTAGRERDE